MLRDAVRSDNCLLPRRGYIFTLFDTQDGYAAIICTKRATTKVANYMHQGSIKAEQRVAAWRALKDARDVIDDLLAEFILTKDTRHMYAKLKIWRSTIQAAIDDTSPSSDRDPFAQLPELRKVVTQLRDLGQHRTDSAAEKIERADGHLMA
jgi:hypothetical protein